MKLNKKFEYILNKHAAKRAEAENSKPDSTVEGTTRQNSKTVSFEEKKAKNSNSLSNISEKTENDGVSFLKEIVKDVTHAVTSHSAKSNDTNKVGNSTSSAPNQMIHMMENDIKSLENDAHFKKMHPKKLKFHKRRYKLDVKNDQLVASTRKCFKRERTCKYFINFSFLY